MKKLVFATLMCVAAVSANAQVLTSETVNSVYDQVSTQANSDFVYNAEWTGKDITTMYVYQKAQGKKGDITLKPHLKYEYSYGTEGLLTSRVTYRWNSRLHDWTITARRDYTLANGRYIADYSRYNHKTVSFEQPMDRMVYTLELTDSVNYISFYHRNHPTDSFLLVSETVVQGLPLFLAKK